MREFKIVNQAWKRCDEASDALFAHNTLACGRCWLSALTFKVIKCPAFEKVWGEYSKSNDFLKAAMFIELGVSMSDIIREERVVK